MIRQCEARTTKGVRCRCDGQRHERVEYTDGVREFLVCQQHVDAINQRSFRPAVHREPLNKESV